MRTTGKHPGALLVLALLLPAQGDLTAVAASRDRPGILLLAHGGSKTPWNRAVEEVAARVEKTTAPVEVAFGMANRTAMQAAVDRLLSRGVTRIVAVPLFVSSHSSVIDATEYLLGQRPEAPPELADFARMSHGHGHHSQGDGERPATDRMRPIDSPVPVESTRALDDHPLVAEILLTRAGEISRDPAQEVVVLVAHGPVSEEENLKWLENMGRVAERMRSRSRYRRIEFLTVRDDAPEPVRQKATEELRATVSRAASDGGRALLVPLLLSYGGIEERIRGRLAGLEFSMPAAALLPDQRIVEWVIERFREAPQEEGGSR